MKIKGYESVIIIDGKTITCDIAYDKIADQVIEQIKTGTHIDIDLSECDTDIAIVMFAVAQFADSFLECDINITFKNRSMNSIMTLTNLVMVTQPPTDIQARELVKLLTTL